MIKYLNNKNIFVKNEEELIYQVTELEIYNDVESNYMQIKLKLIAGIDYITEDSSEQGYVKANRFIEDVQENIINCYFLEESIKESLLANDYNIIEKLPNIQ